MVKLVVDESTLHFVVMAMRQLSVVSALWCMVSVNVRNCVVVLTITTVVIETEPIVIVDTGSVFRYEVFANCEIVDSDDSFVKIEPSLMTTVDGPPLPSREEVVSRDVKVENPPCTLTTAV